MSKIEICKKCTQRKFDPSQGVVCGLTNAKPFFETSCSSFEQDTTVNVNAVKALRPNDQRAKYAILFIWIVLALEIAALASSYMQYNLLTDAANGLEITTEAADLNDTREGFIAIVYTIVSLLSAVTFILWFRRAYYNLHQNVNHLSQTEGWAAGSWFVPIVNLYRPYQIMKELYLETKEFLIKNGITIRDSFTISNLGVWWTLWIVSNIVGQFIFRYSLRAETIDELTISTVAEIVGSLIGIPLALITIRVIRDYSRVEPLLNEIK